LPEPARVAPLERPIEPAEPTQEDEREAAQLAAPIEDENLRKVVAKTIAASLRKAAERPPRLVD
jgi:hypothetical protein